MTSTPRPSPEVSEDEMEDSSRKKKRMSKKELAEPVADGVGTKEGDHILSPDSEAESSSGVEEESDDEEVNCTIVPVNAASERDTPKTPSPASLDRPPTIDLTLAGMAKQLEALNAQIARLTSELHEERQERKNLEKQLAAQRNNIVEGMVAAEIGGVTYVSCYAPPSWNFERFRTLMEAVVTAVHGCPIVVLAGDFNAAASEWGEPPTSQRQNRQRRGEELLATAELLGLRLLNRGNTPTFLGRGVARPSIIDVTFASPSIASGSDWKGVGGFHQQRPPCGFVLRGIATPISNRTGPTSSTTVPSVGCYAVHSRGVCQRTPATPF
uniref:Endonuclease/exonuclease/phosphatase domain-containing protein n=1 Tax=Anopheles atroparvus TaxID=41427 RepID=A0A182JMU6_ANOAO